MTCNCNHRAELSDKPLRPVTSDAVFRHINTDTNTIVVARPSVWPDAPTRPANFTADSAPGENDASNAKVDWNHCRVCVRGWIGSLTHPLERRRDCCPHDKGGYEKLPTRRKELWLYVSIHSIASLSALTNQSLLSHVGCAGDSS